MSTMEYRAQQRGSVLTVSAVILLAVFLLMALGFGIWAFGSRQDYKDNADAKVQAAVQANTKEVQAKDAKDYAEAAKQPLKTYSGPEAYGSVHISYPKTWSAYVVTGSDGEQPLDAYFNPDYVPSASDEGSVFALRVQVVPASYSQTLESYSSLQKQGKVSVVPYALAKTPKAVGVRIDGQLTTTKQGSMVILPLRDKTLKLWVESSQYLADFNNNILPNASFSP